MENEEKISFNHKGFEYCINKTISEYIIDEPCGGGKSVNYKIKNGIPFHNFKHFIDENYVNLNFLNKVEKNISNLNNILLIEYEYNYIWELGFKDYIYLVVLSDNKNNVIKYSFSEYENSLKKLSSKF